MVSNDLILFLMASIIGGIGGWSVAKWGKRLSLLDRPNERSSHKGVVPKGGGIGILAAFFVCSIILSVPKSFWIPAVLLSLFSFWGDRSEIRARTRLLFQFVAGTTLLMGILWEKESVGAACALIFPLAIFVVGTTNFYNFMDGINGIAGITGVVGFWLLGWFAVLDGADQGIISLCTCMSLSCLGFLPFNMPKAKVFMGDVGSILLGFIFAGMVVVLSKDFLDFVCLTTFIFPFYADELTTMTVRIRDGENLLRPHRRHFYQLLANEMGIPHWKISFGYGILQFLVGLSVLAVKSFGILAVLFLLAVYYGGFVWVSWNVRGKVSLV